VRRFSAFLCGIACLALVGGCHRDHRYESVGQLVRKNVTEVDDKGKPIQIDVEIEWDPCPGDQFQVVRGGPEFAECMAKYEPGDYMSAKVHHWWNPLGYYTWDVYELGECKRGIEFGEGSYEKSQECDEVTDYGKKTGFKCSRRPFRKLVAICPFMARQ